ncbi:hypothetical protein FGO68_gene16787 [Halteria grandinella]|uniref:Uncharacterized protein n=1 Tax=Halteria grandinella TaxID=5974 RepID=A0A8J8N9T3_HALGN|nr:hypothetical protein FGO68_gene16787 [Halteria grandinella]
MFHKSISDTKYQNRRFLKRRKFVYCSERCLRPSAARVCQSSSSNGLTISAHLASISQPTQTKKEESWPRRLRQRKPPPRNQRQKPLRKQQPRKQQRRKSRHPRKLPSPRLPRKKLPPLLRRLRRPNPRQLKQARSRQCTIYSQKTPQNSPFQDYPNFTKSIQSTPRKYANPTQPQYIRIESN